MRAKPILGKYLAPIDTGGTDEEAGEPHSSVRGGGADPANPCAGLRGRHGNGHRA